MAIDGFLEEERRYAGWRFWVLFVILTNIGLFAGRWVERFLFGEATLYIATTLAGIGQAWVLSRHFPERGQWAVATAAGWTAGGLLSERLLPPDLSFTLELFLHSLIAGAVMGFPLWAVLRRYLPGAGPWWVLVSAVGSAVQLPGMVMGGVILWLMKREADEGGR